MRHKTRDAPKSLDGHLEDLRKTLIRMGCVIFAGFLLALFFHQEIFFLVTYPLKHHHSIASGSALQEQTILSKRITNTGLHSAHFTLPAGANIVGQPPEATGEDPSSHRTVQILPNRFLDIEYIQPVEKLAIFGPGEGMGLICRVCFFFSLAATSPLWLSFLLDFIFPALHGAEKTVLKPFLALSGLFLGMGLIFAYFITIPVSNALLWTFNQTIGENIWSLANYVDFTIFLLLASSLAFELSLVIFFLVHLRIVTEEWMIEHRKHMIILSLVLGALLTPPDIASQLFVAIPLIGLYEAAIVYAKIRAVRVRAPSNF